MNVSSRDHFRDFSHFASGSGEKLNIIEVLNILLSNVLKKKVIKKPTLLFSVPYRGKWSPAIGWYLGSTKFLLLCLCKQFTDRSEPTEKVWELGLPSYVIQQTNAMALRL